MNAEDKYNLYHREKLEFSGKGWNGILTPLNDFYKNNKLYFFSYTRNIKEKFGALRVSINIYDDYNNILKNKSDKDIDELEPDEELFSSISKYEADSKILPSEIESINTQIVKQISSAEIKYFFHFFKNFKASNNNSITDKEFVKKMITNSINKFTKPQEHIKDYGYLNHKMNLLALQADAVSQSVCMNCSKIGSIKSHKPGSIFMSCKCHDCSAVEASGDRVDLDTIEANSINQFSVYDLEIASAFNFYQKYTKTAKTILNTPIESLGQTLTKRECMDSVEFTKSKFEALTHVTELLNFIEFKQKYLNCSEKINPFIMLLLFTKEVRITGLFTPTGDATKFLQAWDELGLGNKIDNDKVLEFLKDFYDRPVVPSMMMKEICRPEVENLMMYIEAKKQKDDLSQAIYEINILPNIKNKI